MNSHSDIKKLLPAYGGDDLPAHDRGMVEEHLKSCPECRSELADLQLMQKLLRTTPEVEPPVWLTARIMAHVRERQELKQSWLKRLFFPLHIKLPLEALSVLFVCVTGYYLSQMVGSELQHTAPQTREELPAAPVPEQRQKHVDTLPVPPAKDLSAASAPKPADQRKTAPMPQPAMADKPASPSFAPAPPKQEQHAEPLAAPQSSGGTERSKPFPTFESYGRTMESAAPEKKVKTARSSEKQADFSAPSAATSNHAAGAPGGMVLPQVTIRLTLTAPTQAPESVRDALTRSGGTIIDEPSLSASRIKARIPVSRFDELLDRLGTIGKIVERPHPDNRSGTVEVFILW